MTALEIPVIIIGGTADLQMPESDAEDLNEAAYSNPDLPLADGLMEGIVGFLE